MSKIYKTIDIFIQGESEFVLLDLANNINDKNYKDYVKGSHIVKMEKFIPMKGRA